ncbi:MAG: hypothetical protein ACPG4Q_05955 [Phycisphaeraceae bacterium]
MKINLAATCVLPAVILVGTLSLPLTVQAQHVNYDRSQASDRIVIRQTIPDPHAVKRRPLTSDRLNTASTRYIDARRGFRPYCSVFGDRASHHRYAAYDDHFGISRPENRPWSYSQRTPRSSVSHFRNEHVSHGPPERGSAATAPVVQLIVSEQLREDNPKVDMKIRIHKDTSAIPTTTGAVLIRADGTVIQIGD